MTANEVDQAVKMLSPITTHTSVDHSDRGFDVTAYWKSSAQQLTRHARSRWSLTFYTLDQVRAHVAARGQKD